MIITSQGICLAVKNNSGEVVILHCSVHQELVFSGKIALDGGTCTSGGGMENDQGMVATRTAEKKSCCD